MSHFQNSTTESPSTVPNPDDIPDDSKYLIVPLVVIIFVMILSLLVYFMAKRRRLDTLRKNILSMYEFDSNEQEWESLTNSSEYPHYTNEMVTTV
ncbi:uncharacterized protein LOC130901592 [Diorhabda carinulata]|uniref:uncharacterized protein LOC130452927 n=1 Tax=Diorhabda sublineata TaxID=1163346 RepID=UPI0024E145B2|nr:uncharacterized protein LOC130452927 [Diorhabda sublineata]XP_057669055.1 uncharacterized protein LOC130901592 [Diorhabda carinulata]